MYGAILIPETEMTRQGRADIGVLFTTNEGYSTMCGHATIGLGRFLVDTHDLQVFPRRDQLPFDPIEKVTILRLHAPCGTIEVQVPTTADGHRSDPTLPVSFRSVDSFATALGVQVNLPQDKHWPDGTCIDADFAYGGAFYCLVPIAQLPFVGSSLSHFNISTASHFAKVLKATINEKSGLAHVYKHPSEPDLSFLYSVIIVNDLLGKAFPASKSSEAGLCIFANGQIDRSPTGSAVSARLASAYASGKLEVGDSWTYHSLVSLHSALDLAFEGTIGGVAGPEAQGNNPTIWTKVAGHAFYTGTHTFVAESGDLLSQDGFTMSALAT